VTATDYNSFVLSKSQANCDDGFTPVWVPDFLFDFQKSLVEWAILRGRAAIFADCGLGKTAMQLTWAENVVRHTNRPVLVLAPLAVAPQTVHEAAKFGVAATRSADGTFPADSRIVVTNYHRLHHFDPADFAGVVCDESSILKNFDGKTKATVTEFMRRLPYRLLCTATAAPNDYVELGTSSEALGYLGYQDMISRFFKQITAKDYLGWGRTKYRLRGHAERDFWRWVCSWARSVRRPSDLGFDDGPFVLPEMEVREHVIKATRPAPGRLFDVAAETLAEQREEARRTLPERCDTVAGLVADTGHPAVAWCHLNEEGDRLAESIPGAEQVSGSDPDERKEELFAGFAAGQFRVLVTKPKIGGFGMNWQHCAHMTFFPSHSFEQYYQSVRRSWRFGQARPVVVDLVTTDGGAGVRASLQKKAKQAELMFSRLVELMNQGRDVAPAAYGEAPEQLPRWLAAS
jgi:hypothetical protein